MGRIVYVAFSRDETLMGFGFPKEEREALVASEPDKFLCRVSPTCATTGLSQLDAIDLDEIRGSSSTRGRCASEISRRRLRRTTLTQDRLQRDHEEVVELGLPVRGLRWQVHHWWGRWWTLWFLPQIQRNPPP